MFPRRVFALVVLVGILPLVAADGVCLPACMIPSAAFGFVPPVTVLSGSVVLTREAWDGLGHTATERGDACFHVSYRRGLSATVSFQTDGSLVATGPDGEPARVPRGAGARGERRAPLLLHLSSEEGL